MRDADPFVHDVEQRQCDVFTLYVGPGRRYTYAALADATGISKSNLHGYSTGTAMPLHNLLRLLAVLPTEAGNMLLAPSGYKLTPIEADKADWAGIGAEASLLTYELFDAQSDGYIDHREAAKLRERCRSLDAKLSGVLE